MSSLITLNHVSKEYEGGLIKAVEDVNLSLTAGKIYVLTGPSGCGKSTLLNLIGTLDLPSNGEILYQGQLLNEIDSLPFFRRHFIGFVFQFHHLIPVLTIKENIELALFPNQQVLASERSSRADSLLEDMAILHLANAYANQISGGERQRGAIARAMVNNPKLLLADEPTGNVDSKTASLILTKLQDHIKSSSGTLLIATHDPNVAAIADVVIEMKDGKIMSMAANR